MICGMTLRDYLIIFYTISVFPYVRLYLMRAPTPQGQPSVGLEEPTAISTCIGATAPHATSSCSTMTGGGSETFSIAHPRRRGHCVAKFSKINIYIRTNVPMYIFTNICECEPPPTVLSLPAFSCVRNI